jgi:hypothetical protein
MGPFQGEFMARFRFLQRLLWFVPTIAVGISILAAGANAQAIAEAAGSTSVSASAVGAAKPAMLPKLPGAATTGAAQHLVAVAGPPAQEVNVREFQAKAGKDAGKVLLRAMPGATQIWINGKIVGKTPLLLVLAPGKYEVEMRGARGETGKSTVDLLPHETREVLVKMHSLYPARVAAPQ